MPAAGTVPAPEICDHPARNTRHHTTTGFRNVWDFGRRASPAKVIQWLLGRAVRQRPSPNQTPFHKPAAEELTAPVSKLRAHWLGHSTVLLRTTTLNFLTDPVFSNRVSPLSFAGPERLVALPLRVAELPRVDVVLLSHNHYDHLDAVAVAELARAQDPLFIVPLGVGANLAEIGVRRFVEMDWWQFVDIDGARISCTPARHFSGRSAFDGNRTLWASFHVQLTNASFYFGGDTGYASFFQEIREALGPVDLALLPIGAYLPRWFMRAVHIDPPEAVRAFVDLEAGQMLGIHWGTFDLADEPLLEPPTLLREHCQKADIGLERVHTPPVGGFVDL